MQYDLTDERDREDLIYMLKHFAHLFPPGVIAEIRPAKRKGDDITRGEGVADSAKEGPCSTSTASS